MTDAAHDHKPRNPWPIAGLFCLFLIANFTLWLTWSKSAASGDPYMPKYALVILIGLITFVQAGLVMALSMHLTRERQIIVGLATLPFITVLLAIFPTLIDILTLKGHEQTYNIVSTLHDYSPHHEHAATGEHGSAAPGEHGAAAPSEEHSAAPAEHSDTKATAGTEKDAAKATEKALEKPAEKDAE
jgi:hypothetical protein